jgi:calcium-dependent protein kinase
MGICSKAREVICCNQMTDIPINQDVNNNTNTESKKYIFTKNNMDESAELNLNNNKSLRERTKKLFETVKEEEKNLELNDIKRFTEIANDIILKQELNDSSKKRVRFKSSLKNVTHIHEQDETESKNDKNKTQLMKHKDLMNELYNENDETGNNDNNNKEDINKSNQDLSENQDEKQIKEKKRGKSVHIKPGSILKENSNNINGHKFIRNKRKSATLFGNSFKFTERLHGLEKTIPVMNETLISKNMGNPDQYYKRIKYLGSGSYGSVYMARNIATDNIVAIKIIEKEESNMIDDMEIQNEINILKKLSHPNIVKVYEFFDSPLNFFIVTEFCKKGELFSYIKNVYKENQLAILFYQVFSGLVYLHEKKILHRDLKLENIMVAETEKDIITGDEYFWIKIIDFGTAKILQKNKAEKSVIGSSYYIAPEVLNQRYNEKCDTWSTGVILYMTLVGSAPFDGKTDDEIIKRIKIGKYNKNDTRYLEHSEEVKDLVNKLLEKDINKRLSAKEALNHPWFEKYGGRRLFSNFLPEDIKPYIENLFNYKYNSKLQELVIAFLVHNLSNNDETLIILKMFRHFNKKGDCKLTKMELTDALYSYKSKAEVDEMVDVLFQRLDGDKNGYIEFEEFLRACVDKKTLMTKKKLKYAFKFLDKNNTNTLNAQKILNAFLAKSNKEFEAIFNITLKEVDKDNDGIINFNEFVELMLKFQ